VPGVFTLIWSCAAEDAAADAMWADPQACRTHLGAVKQEGGAPLCATDATPAVVMQGKLALLQQGCAGGVWLPAAQGMTARQTAPTCGSSAGTQVGGGGTQAEQPGGSASGGSVQQRAQLCAQTLPSPVSQAPCNAPLLCRHGTSAASAQCALI
jgi:hypothetical protein